MSQGDNGVDTSIDGATPVTANESVDLADLAISHARLVAFNQYAGALNIDLPSTPTPLFKVTVPGGWLAVPGGQAIISVTLAAEWMELSGTVTFEFLRPALPATPSEPAVPIRVFRRACFASGETLTMPVAIPANDYGFTRPEEGYEVVVTGQGKGRLHRAVLTVWVLHHISA